MQPLKILNNVQKARLIHALFIQEIPAFLEFLEAQCLIIEDNREQIKQEWKQTLLTANMWLELSDENREVFEKILRKGYETAAPYSATSYFFVMGQFS